MNQTKMAIRIDIETQRQIQGVKHPNLAATVTATGNALMALTFPGTPEDSSPIMQDLISGRADTVLAQAIEALQRDAHRLVAALDKDEDIRLAAIPVVVVEAPAVTT